MRRFAIIFLLIVVVCGCGGSGGDSPGDIPDDVSTPCLAWDGLSDSFRINLGGEEWEVTDTHFCIDHLDVGTYESYIRKEDTNDNPLRFQIEVTEYFIEIIPGEWTDHFGEPLIWER